jgi:hypothetical protein
LPLSDSNGLKRLPGWVITHFPFDPDRDIVYNSFDLLTFTFLPTHQLILHILDRIKVTMRTAGILVAALAAVASVDAGVHK